MTKLENLKSLMDKAINTCWRNECANCPYLGDDTFRGNCLFAMLYDTLRTALENEDNSKA